jgi:TusA-related sulfurtransferase
MSSPDDYFLDITDDVCPMTFVRTRLLIEKMNAGETAEIRLTGGEPLENVPDSVAELGHEVLGITREEGGMDPGIHRIRVRKR